MAYSKTAFGGYLAAWRCFTRHVTFGLLVALIAFNVLLCSARLWLLVKGYKSNTVIWHIYNTDKHYVIARFIRKYEVIISVMKNCDLFKCVLSCHANVRCRHTFFQYTRRWSPSKPVPQIAYSFFPLAHNAPLYDRNVHTCVHFCYGVVHRGIFVWRIVVFVGWIYHLLWSATTWCWSVWWGWRPLAASLN